MSKLLHISSSPRKDRSASIEVAQSFISTFQNTSTDNRVKTLNVWNEVLPEFDGNRINAKYRVMHGESPTQEEALAWEEITKIVDQFKAADHYLFSLPMWNFSIPYKLKHYIDLISQPGLTWSFSPDTGYQGLVTGKSATLILARGGEYSSSAEANAMDFQKTYMEMILGFMGFQDINTVLVEPTLADSGSVKNTLTASKKKAMGIARQL
jgi:FMN-dependent NADH-azoreductase